MKYFTAAALLALARPSAAGGDPAADAAAACATLNLTEQLKLMRGFGPIAGYSRNSGCGGICGRATYRWDNGPQGSINAHHAAPRLRPQLQRYRR